MSEIPLEKSNASLVVLVIAGVILALVGVVGTFVAKGAAESANADTNLGNQFASALGDPTAAVSPDYTFMWVWIVVGAIGVLLTLGGVVVAAARR